MGNQPGQRFGNQKFDGVYSVSYGPNSSNTVSNYQGAPQNNALSQRLDELDRVIVAHQSRLRDVDDLRAAVQAIKDQASGGRPSTGVVKTLLLGLTSAAAGVDAVAGAVEKVRAALGV